MAIKAGELKRMDEAEGNEGESAPISSDSTDVAQEEVPLVEDKASQDTMKAPVDSAPTDAKIEDVAPECVDTVEASPDVAPADPSEETMALAEEPDAGAVDLLQGANADEIQEANA